MREIVPVEYQEAILAHLEDRERSSLPQARSDPAWDYIVEEIVEDAVHEGREAHRSARSTNPTWCASSVVGPVRDDRGDRSKVTYFATR